MAINARIAAAEENIRELSLHEAIAIGLEQSIDWQQEDLKAKIAEEQYQMVRAKWFPQLSMDAKVVFWNSDSTMDIALGDYIDGDKIAASIPPTIKPFLGDSVDEMISQLASSNVSMNLRDPITVFYGIQIMQPLTPLFQVYEGVRMAEAGKRVVDETTRQQQLKVSQEIVSVYLQLVYAQMMVKVLEEVVQTVEAHVAQAQRIKESGLVGSSTVLSAEVELNKAKQNLYEARNGAMLASLKLGQTLNLGRNQRVYATDIPEGLIYTNVGTLEECQDKALKNRTEFQQLETAIEVHQHKAKLALYEYIPKVAAIARYEFAYGTAMQPMNQAYFGIGMDWKFFDGFEKYHEAKKAEYEAMTYQTQSAQANDLIALEVSQKYLNLQNALQRTEMQLKSEALASENLRITNLQFAYGEAVNTDVLSAQTQWEAAKAGIVKSQIDVLTALSELRMAMGDNPEILPEEFIGKVFNTAVNLEPVQPIEEPPQPKRRHHHRKNK